MGRVEAPAAGEAQQSFPAGGGELGRLIREYDWAATPLGPIGSWPPALKTATNIVLQSPLPLVMLWGPDGIMIYNDAYSAFAGQRHPWLLGSKVLEGWAEVADFNARVLEVGLAGGVLSFKDQELTLYRNNVAEQVWMDLNYGPVLGDDDRPAGVLAIVVETTERVRAERRQAFLFGLGERLRELSDAESITGAAAQILGRHLGVDRVHWAWIDEEAATFSVASEWNNGAVRSLVGRHRLDAFGGALIERMRTGGTIVITDALANSLTEGGDVDEAFEGSVRGCLAVPLVRGGGWRAALCIHTATPRVWRDDERDLAREVAERTWSSVRRAEAEARQREADARFRALVNATSDVVYRMSADWREMRALDGRGFLPDTDEPSIAWQDVYLYEEDKALVQTAADEAVRTKGVFQLEHRVKRIDGGVGWMFSRAIPLTDEVGEVVEWFGAATDITERRRTEEHLRLVVNELNHRVKNNLAMTQAIAAQTFRGLKDSESAQANFTGRLMALAQANDLLTGERWVGASLKSVLAQALKPYGMGESGRCRIEGPDVPVSSKTALSLSLAAHELATNAMKYGAWSAPQGAIVITWRVDGPVSGERLHLEWRERGGPAVAGPARRGFGSRLIERGLAAEMGGEAKLDFQPEGLVCTLDAPLVPPGVE